MASKKLQDKEIDVGHKVQGDSTFETDFDYDKLTNITNFENLSGKFEEKD
jgi:hypothetical protein